MKKTEHHWGPLECLIGTWAGEVEHQVVGQSRSMAFEVRTFERRPAIYCQLEDEYSYPLFYTARVLDGVKLKVQFYEESGYWVWRPSTNQLFQMTMVPFGTSVSTSCPVRQIGESYSATLAAGGDSANGSLVNNLLSRSSLTTQLKFTVQFDRNRFRYQRATTMFVAGQGATEFRDEAELVHGRPKVARSVQPQNQHHRGVPVSIFS